MESHNLPSVTLGSAVVDDELKFCDKLGDAVMSKQELDLLDHCFQSQFSEPPRDYLGMGGPSLASRTPTR